MTLTFGAISCRSWRKNCNGHVQKLGCPVVQCRWEGCAADVTRFPYETVKNKNILNSLVDKKYVYGFNPFK